MEYLQSPCIAIPIRMEGLPTSMITASGESFAVNWADGKAWEVRQDIRPAAVNQRGGTLLLVHVE